MSEKNYFSGEEVPSIRKETRLQEYRQRLKLELKQWQ